jgi:hypothetical protein
MLPYSGPIGYDGIRDEFGGPNNFTLKSAYNGSYGSLNTYSYIQPTNTGGLNYSPTNWYGYDGKWVVQSGLVTNWDAWPTIGSYPGSGISISDVSGNGTNGRLINGTSWNATNGGSWVFDGSDDYVISTRPPYAQFGDQITVDFWVKWEANINHGQGVGQAVYNNYDGPPPDQNMWLMHGNGGGSQTVTFYAWDAQLNLVSGGNSSYLTTGNWYNIVCTMGSSSSRMYTNGVQTGSGGGLGPGLNNNPNADLFMGGDVRYDFRRMNGNIAALKVYDSELSSDDVVQNYDALRGRFGI